MAADRDAAILDVRGRRCPIPVLKARKALSREPSGTVLMLVSDDPVALIDVAHFCHEDGHTLLSTVEGEAGAVTFKIQKG